MIIIHRMWKRITFGELETFLAKVSGRRYVSQSTQTMVSISTFSYDNCDSRVSAHVSHAIDLALLQFIIILYNAKCIYPEQPFLEEANHRECICNGRSTRETYNAVLEMLGQSEDPSEGFFFRFLEEWILFPDITQRHVRSIAVSRY